MDNSTPPPPAPTTPPLGGYALTKLRIAGGEETVRFEATLTHMGVPIAVVSNGGTGGSDRYIPLHAGRDALDAFEAFAREWNKDSDLAGWEDGDQLVSHLIEVTSLNRRRVVVYEVDDDAWFAEGRAHAFGATVSREDALVILRSSAYAGRNPRIWDPAASAFVPVV